MRMLSRKLLHDQRGVSAIEFALLTPILICMLLGVMQAGLYMQAHNALSSITNDMSRFMSVEYQRQNKVTNDLLESYAYTRAVSPPYLLQGEKLSVEALDAESQTIANVREIKLVLKYRVPDIMAFASFGAMNLSYTRSIYVSAE